MTNLIQSILTVQPSRAKKHSIYRLGLDRATSQLVKRGQIVTLKLSYSNVVTAKIACGPPNKKTYDVNHVDLNIWIKANGFHDYIPRQPTRLVFHFDVLNRTFTYNQRMQTSP